LKWVLLLCIAVSQTLSWGQQYNFISFGVIDGLAQSQVTDICQDQLGNLWIGTQSGLSRFDSKKFVNFSMDDGLADNVISEVVLSESGELWVVTPRGISKYMNGKFQSFYFENNERINDVINFNGQFILATNQTLIAFDGSDFSIVFESPNASLKIRALEKLSDSTLLCATNEGLFKFKKGAMAPFQLVELPNLNLSDIKIRGHQLILATFNAGIIVYNMKSDLYTQYLVEGIPIRSLFVDEVSIWAASNFGALEIRNGQTSYYTEQNGLNINSVKTVFKDMESNIWIGTYGKGLLKFTGNAITSFSTKDQLSSDIIMSIAQFQDGSFVFGTYDKGLNIMKPNGSVDVYDNTTGLVHNSVWATYVDYKNRCWIGTTSGLQCIKSKAFILEELTKQIDKKIRSIFAEDSTIYFGGTAGLWLFQHDSLWSVESASAFDINKVVLTQSEVVLATRQGLYYQHKNKLHHNFIKIPLPEENINTVAIDKFQNIWVGTINGLYIVSPNVKPKFFELDKSNYKSKNIMGIIKDRQDQIWVSTTHGLYMVANNNPVEGLAVLNQYTLSEGLIDMESNLNSLFQDSSGNIWMGTSSALARINPVLNPVLFSYSLPKLSITGLRLFKEAFNYADYEIGELMSTGVPKSISLPHTKNHLTFDFIGVNNKNPEKVFYTYRLLGAEENWSPITKESSASYSFISPGSYEFQVKSANKNLEWTEPVVVSITITPPFWKRWWFIVAVSASIILLAYFVLNARISNIKQKKDNERLVSENKLRNLEQQSLNASMNRHFIFNSLNSIQYFINSSDKKSANKYLSNFAQLIRKNLDSSMQPNFLVSLNEEIERISLYLTLEKMRFNEKFDYAINVDEDIDAEMIQVPSMILQPFVENSIIHGVLPKAEKGQINITIKEENGFIVFEVVDDGVGIDSSMSSKDSFKGDHKSQGMEITANRIDLLRQINGDKLMIIGPFQINRDGKAIGTKVIIKLPGY
jgi:ligand-binding sensor domain-containing protein